MHNVLSVFARELSYTMVLLPRLIHQFCKPFMRSKSMNLY